MLHRLLNRRGNLRTALGGSGLGVVSKADVIRNGLRVLHKDLIGERPHVVRAARRQDRPFHLLARQCPALHEHVQLHHAGRGGRGDHVGNLRGNLFCKIDVAASGPGAAVRIHGGPHQLIIFFIGGPVGPAAGFRDVLAAGIIVIQVDGRPDLPRRVAVAHRPGSHAADGNVSKRVPDANAGVGLGGPDKTAAGVRHPRPGRNEDGRILRLGNGKADGADGGFRLRTRAAVGQLRQGIQVFPLRPAGDVLVGGVVGQRPLLDQNAGNPLDKQPLRTGRADRGAGEPLIDGCHQRRHGVRVRGDKLIFRIPRH